MFNNVSLKYRLIIGPMFIISIALIAVALITIRYQSNLYREQFLADSQALSKVVATNIEPAILFDDHDAMLSTLSSLSMQKNVACAFVFGKEFNVEESKKFDEQLKLDSNWVKAKLINRSVYVDDNYLLIKKSITNDKEHLAFLVLVMSQKSYNEQVSTIKQFFILLTVFILVISFLAFFFLQQNVLRPILNLTQASKDISQLQIYKEVPVTSKDELGYFTATFNKMVKDIVGAKELSEESRKIKEVFFAKISHELRTPLNAIVGLSKLMKNAGPLNDKQDNYSKVIIQNANNLVLIINDLLDFSKIEQGKMELENKIFNLSDVAESVVKSFEYQAQKKDVEILFESNTSEKIYALGDSLKLSQVFVNLLSNAVKFTNNGKIILHLKVEEEFENSYRIYFGVQDSGIGMTEEESAKIFTAFTQANNSVTRKYGGTGLGLSISREFVKMMGGNMEVKSVKNEGTTFYFTLNILKPSVDLIEKVRLKEGKQKSENAGTSVPQLQVGRTYRILAAEDNAFNQLVLKDTIASWSLPIVLDIAENGELAIEMLKVNSYDLVLMDVQMPVMDGNTAAQKIRQEMPIPLRDIPIIAMTAHASNEEKEKCFTAGMNDYLTKPFEPQDLYNKIFTYAPKSAPLQEGAVLVNREEEKVDQEQREFSFDLEQIKSFCKNKPERIQKMMQMFIDDTPNEIQKIKDTYSRKDFPALRTAAHSMKPKYTYMGLPQLSEMAKQIEMMANTGEENLMIEDLTNQLEDKSTLAVIEMKKYMKVSFS